MNKPLSQIFVTINMHTTYFDEDDILVIRLSDKPITLKTAVATPFVLSAFVSSSRVGGAVSREARRIEACPEFNRGGLPSFNYVF
jgi:hypothetical protein